ncbi:MAG TPA: hypothetical protein VGL02_27395 [Streptomyces sp.]
MIKPRRSQWPNPGDTPLDRARAIARDLHRRLARHDPAEAAHYAQALADLGETWLTPQPVLYNDHDWITLDDAATYTNGTRDMIYKWTIRYPNQLPTRKDDRGRILVRVGAVLDMQREQRQRRAERNHRAAS